MNAGISANLAALDAEVLARQVLGWDRARFLTDRDERPRACSCSVRAARGTARAPRAGLLHPRHARVLGSRLRGRPRRADPSPRNRIHRRGNAGARWTGLRSAHRRRRHRSGCIAIALAREIPGSRIIATDVSTHALGVARRNAARARRGRSDYVRRNQLPRWHRDGPTWLSRTRRTCRPSRGRAHAGSARLRAAVALFAGEDGLDGCAACSTARPRGSRRAAGSSWSSAAGRTAT